jgi:LCP family protein required for cell wall assembly
MKNKKLTYLLIIDVVVAFFAMVFVMVAMWNRPLGPSLANSANPTQPLAALSPGTANGDVITQTQPADPTPGSLLSQITSLLSPNSTQPVKTLCGGPPVMYILLIGSDERGTDYNYGLADSTRIVRVDFTKPSVTMLDFPRDLWVEIPGISDHYGITHAKLNQAYFFGNPGMGYYDGPDAGPGLMAQTLQLNFGAQVDHYLAMDMSTFIRMVDAVDGIDIHIYSKIDFNGGQDGANPNLVYEPGNYHLDGTQALMFARDRNPTIFQRARYQTMILNALEQKLLTPNMIPVWPQIIADFSNSVQTDLSPNEISQLVCLAKKLNNESVTTVAFPDDMFGSTHTYDPYRKVYTYTLDVDFNQIRAYVADFNQGVWP